MGHGCQIARSNTFRIDSEKVEINPIEQMLLVYKV